MARSMAIFEHDGVRIHYEAHGRGEPVLLLAPGGMRSRRAAWATPPWNPMKALPDHFRVIAMDQRNAGDSTAPIAATDGWSTYTADQLALMDHLGIERFAVVGMCIGGPFIMGLVSAAPERIRAGVMLQPIGLENNQDAFFQLFDGWVAQIRGRHPEADDAAWASFRRNMFGRGFMFGASPEDVAACRVPLLVLMGNDLYHPPSISRSIAELAPHATLIEQWKLSPHLEEANQTIRTFLTTHL